MHWSIFVLLMGAVAGTRAQPTDSAVDSACPPPPPPRCGINEHLESNSNKCQLTCSNMKYEAVMGACAPTSDCYCNKGYVRDEEGICIKREDCSPPRCPKGQVWNDCGSSCPPSCDNRNNTCLVCTMQCVSGCFCAGDTVRAPDGSCVKPKNCPPRTCSGPNEEFVNCPPTCPRTEKCENLWSKIPCTPIDCCEPKCRCKPGFHRNDQNVCVSAKECCLSRCPKGEVWNDCGSSCPPSCDNRNNTCLVCTKQCVSGCFCAGDTVRAPDGSCVKPKNCPPRTCSGPNEEFVNCPPTCPRTEKCENLWSKIPCTPIDCCEPKCRCKPGFHRNDQNVCVSAKECSLLRCPKGKVWNDCGSSCPPSCDNRNNTCLVCTMQCVSGCFCAGDTVRAPDGSCVKPKNCPPRTCSGPNEEFVNCPPTCPRTEKCENLWSKIPCTPIDCCEPKCRCKPGFHRNDQNVCVSAKECCLSRCPKGEVWNDCGSSCPPSCDNRNNTCLVCTKQCVSGCFCAGDTVRAPDGSCVKPKNCPPRTCSGPNEEFVNCPPTCPRTEKCENLWSKIPCTPIDCCEPKCRCKSGFYRNYKNVCVSAKECSSAQCGEGEVYSDCNSSCSELCEDRGNTCLACAAVCVPGCYCAGNTFRAPNGTCVKPENCPRRTCGRNEVFDKCPPTCPRTEECKNLWSKEPCRPIDCCRPSCRCKPGYYRNKQNNCVSARECSGSPPCNE